ncbi:RodZ domain-containing protein [Streptomyces sp. NPDC048436]|uniref:RodZ domain-containing protein n=1 Tax=Streptomyces sp. NPDC048436 TaxID=3365550 RepID=UPI0037217B41
MLSARVRPAQAGDPARIGPYRIVGRLGAGGMGTVLAGLDTAGLRVAVKLIHQEHAGDHEFRARFRREVALSRRVTGPCLVPLLAADTDAERPWLATAYAPGLTLNEHVSAHGPLTGGNLHAFATGTATALAAIHAAGVIHRDLKPQNIVLAPDGPRVLDFGIAHALDGTSVTRSGVLTGTPGWVSPELYRAGRAGPEGDMFAWAALVAYAATGRLPFGAGTPDVLAYRIMSESADLDGVPGALAEILERALAKQPDDRPTAVEATEWCAGLLAQEVTQVVGQAEGEGTRTEPAQADTRVEGMVSDAWNVPTFDDPGWAAAPRGNSLRRTVTVALAALAVAGVITGGVVVLNQQDESGGTPSTAESPSPKSPQNTAGQQPAPENTPTPDPENTPTTGPSSDPSSDPAGTPTDGSTPTDGEPSPTGDGVTVKVSAEDVGSWVSAKKHNGRLLFDGTLEPGESKTFTDKEQVNLVLGDAGSVRLVVNGVPVEDTFEPGQVERLSYTPGDPNGG